MKYFIHALFALLLALPVMTSAEAVQPKNIIIMIGDGMGFNHVDAGSLYRYGRSRGQVYWEFTNLAMQTYSLSNEDGYDPFLAYSDFEYVKKSPTDSAAAATAMSTGFKTQNGLIGQRKDSGNLPHIMEDAEALGKSTGVLTTVYFSHATPAGFVAHNPSRNNYQEIAQEMIWESGADLIIGAGHPWYDDDGKQVGGVEPDRFKTSLKYDRVGGLESWKKLLNGEAAADADGDGDPDPWNLVTTREGIQNLAKADNPGRVLGVLPVYSTLQADRSGNEDAGPFEVPLLDTSPTMAELMGAALHALSMDPDCFVLMAEGGAIDWASHGNQSGRLVEEQIDFDRAVEYTVSWIEKNSSWDETLLIVTADHECGYLTGIG
ncbi:MAG: alkaline phosphatase, partial [Candidatus Hinthialibacter sp.]